MADATLVALAKDVTTQLGGASFAVLNDQTVEDAGGTVVRTYTPWTDANSFLGPNAGIPQPTLQVVTNHDETAWGARGVWNEEPMVDVGVQGLVVAEPDDIDTLMLLAEQVADFLRAMTPTVAGAGVLKTRYAPAYDPGQLGEDRLFTAIVQVFFKLIRSP